MHMGMTHPAELTKADRCYAASLLPDCVQLLDLSIYRINNWLEVHHDMNAKSSYVRAKCVSVYADAISKQGKRPTTTFWPQIRTPYIPLAALVWIRGWSAKTPSHKFWRINFLWSRFFLIDIVRVGYRYSIYKYRSLCDSLLPITAITMEERYPFTSFFLRV